MAELLVEMMVLDEKQICREHNGEEFAFNF